MLTISTFFLDQVRTQDNTVSIGFTGEFQLFRLKIQQVQMIIPSNRFTALEQF